MRKLDPAAMTKAERLQWAFGVDALRMIEHDLHDVLMARRALPAEWHEISADDDRRDVKRVRVTISLDADVVKFFKAMGPGYQPRMNRVLRAFMHLRLAKVIEGPDTTDYILKPEEVLRSVARRVEWGASGEGF